MKTHRSGMDRRAFGRGLGAVVGASLAGPFWLSATSAAGQSDLAEQLVIDLDGELESIHPSLAYSARDWSIVNSVYDSIVMVGDDGQVVPLVAESFSTEDAITFNTVLRSGITFHDGSPVTAETLRDSWTFLMESDSSVIDLFQVIDDIEVVGDLEANIVCSAPSPWLPAQIATWLMLVPFGYTEEMALNNPIGTGPFMLDTYSVGEELTLQRNQEYALGAVKGEALAEEVTFRIVPEASTRVADVVTGTANIAVSIPQDFRAEVESQGATVLDDPIVGSQWVRIATDVAPFDDARVRRALNLAVDVETIATALLAPETRPLATIFPDDRSPGFKAELELYGFDPDAARRLLEEAGVAEGKELVLETSAAARQDVAEAIAANLEDVGFAMTIEATDIATFNAGWSDPERPVLRLATWSPLHEPHTLLGLVFKSDGFLSRYSSEEVDALLAEAAVEADPDVRRAVLEQVAAAMYDDPPVIALWNLTATYAVDDAGSEWMPSGDEQVVPTTTAAVAN
ncbi:ABC transporter substrate-binding protein [soil metagenome]